MKTIGRYSLSRMITGILIIVPFYLCVLLLASLALAVEIIVQSTPGRAAKEWAERSLFRNLTQRLAEIEDNKETLRSLHSNVPLATAPSLLWAPGAHVLSEL